MPFRLLALLIALVTLAGCSDPLDGGGADASFLRQPEPSPAPLALTQPLIPTAIGSWWIYSVRAPDGAISQERHEITGTQATPAGRAIVLTITAAGKPAREEWYLVDGQGIRQAAAGGREKVTMSPPAPVVRLPIVPEEVITWQGNLVFRSVATPSRGWCRAIGEESIVLSGKTYTAIRTENILDTRVEGRNITFPTTRWIVPGIGVVKTRLFVGRSPYLKEIIRYGKGGR